MLRIDLVIVVVVCVCLMLMCCSVWGIGLVYGGVLVYYCLNIS